MRIFIWASFITTFEIGLSRPTVHSMRRVLQSNAQVLQPNSPLADEQTETDEMFQNAGEKK